jgi:hypothetical protein
MPELPIELPPPEPAPRITAPPLPGGGITVPPPPSPPITQPEPAPPEPDVIGPQAPQALPELGKLGLLLLVLALIALGSALNDFFNWLFRFMLGPLARGRTVPQTTSSQLTQKLSNALGTAYGGVDADIGASFTKLATLNSRSSLLAVKAAAVIRLQAQRIARLEGNAQTTTAAQLAGKHATAAAAATAAHAAQRTAVLGQTLAADQQGTTARLTALEHNVTHLIEPELDALKSAIPELHKGLSTAWDEIAKHEGLFGDAAMAAAVATGIGALGASWIECEATKLLGKAACQSGPSNIKRLLEGLFDIAAILDLCQLVTLLVDVAESGAVQDVLLGLTDGIDALIQCRGIEVKKPLSSAAYARLAPPGTYAALAPVG